MSPLVPPGSFLVATVAVELVMLAPEVTSKDMRQPVFSVQPIGGTCLPKLVTLKKIKSVPAGCVPPLVLLELKNSVTGEHTGGPDVEVARAGPVLTVPSTPVADTGIWYNVGRLLLIPEPPAQTYMFPAPPRNQALSKAPL
jgi:hypothetical protein